jgi:hypothetical protein
VNNGQSSITWVFAELGAALAIAGGWFDYLPKVAVLLGVLWYLIQIYEYIKRKTRHEVLTELAHHVSHDQPLPNAGVSSDSGVHGSVCDGGTEPP